MSNRALNTLAIFMVILMAGAAFAAGYFVRELVDRPVRARADGERLTAAEFDVFWEAWDRVEESFVDPLPAPQRLVYGAIRGALGELQDPYTVFVDPPDREVERETLRGNFGGIGARLSRNETGEVVLDPIPGNPAASAGILLDDVLLAVDGQAITAEMSLETVAQLVRGEKGSRVTLTIRRTGQATPMDVVVVRDDILIPSVAFRLLKEDPGIGYIQLTRFTGESDGEVRAALQELQVQGADRIILDLRGNGGGLLDAAVDVADHFLRDGLIMTQRSRDAAEQTFRASSEAAAGDLPLVLLIDGGTASAAEIVAGALQDRQRAVLIGSHPTFGKGSVQLVYDLSDGSSVHVTASRWYTPDGHQIDQQGLAPDLLVQASEEDIQNGRDVVLERAVQYLSDGS